MKQAMMIMLIIISLTNDGKAQETSVKIWMENQINTNGIDPRLKGVASHTITPHWSAFCFFMTKSTYGQFYCGPQAVINNITIGTGIGLDSTDNWRAGANLGYKTKHIRLQSILEWGGAGLFYSTEAGWVSTYIELSAFIQRKDGLGPKFAVNLFSTGIQIWTAILYDLETDKINGLLTMQVKM